MTNHSAQNPEGEDLPRDIAAKVDALCMRGNELAEAEQDDEAIRTFQEAYSLLPEPVERWYAATWIQVAIGDTAFLKGDLETAATAFRTVGRCAGWVGNPFIRLRRGQVALELGDHDMAVNELASAFMLGGYEIFDSVDDKYAEFALAKLLPPVPPVDHPLARFHLEPSSQFSQPDTAGVQKRRWWKFW